MIRMSVNRILPFLLLLVLFTSCNRKYKIEGSSSVTSLDGKMLFLKTLRDGQWVNVDSAEVIHGHFKMKGRTPLNDKLYEFIDKRNSLEVKIEELERKEARMVLDGANLDDVHGQLAKEGEALVKEMNDYVRQFIVDNFENVLGPSVFMMMCSTLPYPVMTPQIEDIMRTAPLSFKENTLVKDFLTKAKENMQLIEEQKRMKQNASVGGQK